jgi:hypothetical protein
MQSMRDGVQATDGSAWPFAEAALKAHAQLLALAVENQVDPDISRALFEQSLDLSKAAGLPESFISVGTYQYATWMYAETEDLEKAREILEESMKVLDDARKAAGDGSGGDEDNDDELEPMNWEHQVRLKWQSTVDDL